uniref:Transcription initiation factor IIE subunit alpha n=1 Tax=Tanacetum cinerariifolium TaxID=118510 RepID=A0A699HQJ6_TANCI|nr:transcription initiation factor IIE subunit alpha [Tanacetum cinerariifolium]
MEYRLKSFARLMTVSVFHRAMIEVAFSGAEEKEIKLESVPLKQFPLWMIKEGMNLTNEERGEEYCKDYYEALLQHQRAQEATSIKEDPSTDNFPTDADPLHSRKWQRNDDEEENDLEWKEETPVLGRC